MFIPTLLTITKTGKPPTCPSTDECIKMWYIYTMDYYSATQKKWNDAICSNVDGPRNYHTKWSQTKKDRLSHDITYMWNKKNDTNELISKVEIDSKTQKTQLWLPNRKGELLKWKSLSHAWPFATPWTPGQNTGVSSCSLLQGIFPTQESNQGLLHCRQFSWIAGKGGRDTFGG